MKRTLPILLLLSVASSSHAGLLSRSRTEAKRADVPAGASATPMVVDGLAIYSFLQDATGANKRLRKDTERFRQILSDEFERRGTRVSSLDALAEGTALPESEVVRRRMGPVQTGSVTTLSEAAKSAALEQARSHRDAEAALPASHRLILLPEQLVHSTGLQWTLSGGISAGGVPHYSFQVYWLLEDTSNRAVIMGKTTGMLDIRGFPAKPMAEQMADEMERLGVRLSGK